MSSYGGAAPAGGPLNEAQISGAGDTRYLTGIIAQLFTDAFKKLMRANAGVDDRNLLINGDFRINQRGQVTNVALAPGAYGHDRWKAGAGGCTYTFTQLASSTVITIAPGKSLIQPVKANDVEGGTYVLSWVGTSQGRLGVNNGTPTGAYANSPIVVSGQSPGTIMSVEFGPGTLGKVKLELGAVPTPFVMIDENREKLRCLEHCWVDTWGAGEIRNGFKIPGAGIQTLRTAPLPMYAVPSVVLNSSIGFQFYNPSTGNWQNLAGTPTVQGAERYSYIFDGGSVDTDNVARLIRNNSGSSIIIKLEAEL